MDNFANLCIIVHTKDIVWFGSMCLIMTKTCVKFHYDMNNFWRGEGVMAPY